MASSLELSTGSKLHEAKVLIAAEYAGVKVALKKGTTATSQSSVTSVAEKNAVAAEFLGPVLRFVAKRGAKGKTGDKATPTDLTGASFSDAGSVDAWVAWVEQELETRTGAAQIALVSANSPLEEHLESRTFVVGEGGVTLADISLCVSLSPLVSSVGCEGTLGKSVARWYRTCLAQEPFAKVLLGASSSFGSLPPPALLGAAVGSSSTAAGSSSSGSSSSSSTNNSKVTHQELMLLPEERPVVAPYSGAVGGRTKLARVLLAPDAGLSLAGARVNVCGWVRTIREQSELAFLSIIRVSSE